MPEPTIVQREALTHRLNDIRERSDKIHLHLDFLRENAGRPAFTDKHATPAELLLIIKALDGELLEAAQFHIPVYLGCCLIDEFGGHWNVEGNPRMAMFGQPYVDGFGNIEYENIHLHALELNTEEDARRFELYRKRCRRAFDLRTRFIESFSHLSGSSILRSDFEQQCLEVLPRGRETKHVWRTRITKYAKLLKIKLKRG